MAVMIALEESDGCSGTHVESGATVSTSAPPEYGGPGRSFSSTDLLAAALGTCVASDLAPVARRHGVPLDGIGVRVDKDLRASPKRLAALRVVITLPAGVPDDVVLRLRRASATCVVRRSLGPDVEVAVSFEGGGS